MRIPSAHDLTDECFVEYWRRCLGQGGFERREAYKSLTPQLEALTAHFSPETLEPEELIVEGSRHLLFCIPSSPTSPSADPNAWCLTPKKGVARNVHSFALTNISLWKSESERLREKTSIHVVGGNGQGNSAHVYFLAAAVLDGMASFSIVIPRAKGGFFYISKKLVASYEDSSVRSPSSNALKPKIIWCPGKAFTVPPLQAALTNSLCVLDGLHTFESIESLSLCTVRCLSLRDVSLLSPSTCPHTFTIMLPRWTGRELALAAIWCHGRLTRTPQIFAQKARLAGPIPADLFNTPIHVLKKRVETAESIVCPNAIPQLLLEPPRSLLRHFCLSWWDPLTSQNFQVSPQEAAAQFRGFALVSDAAIQLVKPSLERSTPEQIFATVKAHLGPTSLNTITEFCQSIATLVPDLTHLTFAYREKIPRHSCVSPGKVQSPMQPSSSRASSVSRSSARSSSTRRRKEMEPTLLEVKLEQAEVRQTQAEVRQAQEEVRQVKAEIRQDQVEIRQDQAEIRQNRAEIRQDQAEIRQDRAASNEEHAELRQEQVEPRQENMTKGDMNTNRHEKTEKEDESGEISSGEISGVIDVDTDDDDPYTATLTHTIEKLVQQSGEDAHDDDTQEDTDIQHHHPESMASCAENLDEAAPPKNVADVEGPGDRAGVSVDNENGSNVFAFTRRTGQSTSMSEERNYGQEEEKEAGDLSMKSGDDDMERAASDGEAGLSSLVSPHDEQVSIEDPFPSNAPFIEGETAADTSMVAAEVVPVNEVTNDPGDVSLYSDRGGSDGQKNREGDQKEEYREGQGDGAVGGDADVRDGDVRNQDGGDRDGGDREMVVVDEDMTGEESGELISDDDDPCIIDRSGGAVILCESERPWRQPVVEGQPFVGRRLASPPRGQGDSSGEYEIITQATAGDDCPPEELDSNLHSGVAYDEVGAGGGGQSLSVRELLSNDGPTVVTGGSMSEGGDSQSLNPLPDYIEENEELGRAEHEGTAQSVEIGVSSSDVQVGEAAGRPFKQNTLQADNNSEVEEDQEPTDRDRDNTAREPTDKENTDRGHTDAEKRMPVRAHAEDTDCDLDMKSEEAEVQLSDGVEEPPHKGTSDTKRRLGLSKKKISPSFQTAASQAAAAVVAAVSPSMQAEKRIKADEEERGVKEQDRSRRHDWTARWKGGEQRKVSRSNSAKRKRRWGGEISDAENCPPWNAPAESHAGRMEDSDSVPELVTAYGRSPRSSVRHKKRRNESRSLVPLSGDTRSPQKRQASPYMLGPPHFDEDLSLLAADIRELEIKKQNAAREYRVCDAALKTMKDRLTRSLTAGNTYYPHE